MSEHVSEPKSETIEPQEITPEQIKQLVEKAISEGKDETRYILKLETWFRQGGSFDDSASFDVIFGDVDIIELKEWNEGYPYRKGHTNLLVPKTVPTIVIWRNRWDYGEDSGEREIVYVFTSEGWKKILVHSSRRY
jgi:hypothetical protein